MADAKPMTTRTKISWVLGIMVSAATLFTFASDFENPVSAYILAVGGEAFAGKQVEQDLVELKTIQSAFLKEFTWLKQKAIREEIYEIRKSQCLAESQFQKDYYNQKMDDLRIEYNELFDAAYHEPDCREIL